jgi:hypothetical protein
MKATELLMKQHRLVEDLFEQFEEAEGAEQVGIFEKLAANLVAHDAIERELFYPACDEKLGKDDDILGESLVEHGVVEFCLFRADMNKQSDDFEKYVKVLQEMVEHHVKEEEKELLPKVKRAFDAEELEKLGARMEGRFEAAVRSDFRKPLRETLDQVLAGKTRTSKKAPAKSANGRIEAKARNARSAPRIAKRSPRRAKAKRAKAGSRKSKSAGRKR